MVTGTLVSAIGNVEAQAGEVVSLSADGNTLAVVRRGPVNLY